LEKKRKRNEKSVAVKPLPTSIRERRHTGTKSHESFPPGKRKGEDLEGDKPHPAPD